MRDRVLASGSRNPDDVADANMILAMAAREGDAQTFLDVAVRYAAEGTDVAKTLQVRKILSRMTPTGMKAWAAGQTESWYSASFAICLKAKSGSVTMKPSAS